MKHANRIICNKIFQKVPNNATGDFFSSKFGHLKKIFLFPRSHYIKQAMQIHLFYVMYMWHYTICTICTAYIQYDIIFSGHTVFNKQCNIKFTQVKKCPWTFYEVKFICHSLIGRAITDDLITSMGFHMKRFITHIWRQTSRSVICRENKKIFFKCQNFEEKNHSVALFGTFWNILLYIYYIIY